MELLYRWVGCPLAVVDWQLLHWAGPGSASSLAILAARWTASAAQPQTRASEHSQSQTKPSVQARDAQSGAAQTPGGATTCGHTEDEHAQHLGGHGGAVVGNCAAQKQSVDELGRVATRKLGLPAPFVLSSSNSSLRSSLIPAGENSRGASAESAADIFPHKIGYLSVVW